MATPVPPEASKEIEQVRSLVAKYFPVYDVRVTYDVVQFYCRVDNDTLEERFESMREDMGKHGYIPMIVYEKGEHIVTVARKPDAKYRSIYVNLGMLVVTFVAMLIAGAMNWAGYANLPSSQLFGAEALGNGLLYFTLPLMVILAVHELAHFLVARRRRVAASLPFFVPSIPPLGTFGAFISLRDPIPNKKTLLEIGIAGPIAGFLMTIPFAVLGLYLTNLEARVAPADISSGTLGVMFPLAYQWLGYLVPVTGDYLLHPMAFAAWVGFLVTGLNLLPVGQLDGGHVARALFGPKARYLTWATIAAMVGLGFLYFGWLIFALFILFIGARHPPPLNDISRLTKKKVVVGAVAFAMLFVSFVPIPLQTIAADHSFTIEPENGTNATIAAGQTQLFQLLVNNTGNTRSDIEFSMSSGPPNWYTQFKSSDQSASDYSQTYTLNLSVNRNATMDVLIHSSVSTTVPNATVLVKAAAANSTFASEVTFSFNITSPALNFTIMNNNLPIARGSYGNVTIVLNNPGPTLNNLTVAEASTSPEIHVVLYEAIHNASTSVTLNLTEGGHAVVTVNIFVLSYATPGQVTFPVQVKSGELVILTMQIAVQVT